jgi:hypothetical protein
MNTLQTAIVVALAVTVLGPIYGLSLTLFTFILINYPKRTKNHGKNSYSNKD